MQRKSINTNAAPAAIGPYSQAIRAGELLFVSGQIPIDPETGKLVDGDMRAQIERVFRNLEAVAEAGGTTLSNAVKITVFLTDLSHFKIVNEVMETFFEQPYPARAALGVAALPLGAEVEADAILIA